MPGWIIWGGLAWILVMIVVIALFRGAALLSGRGGDKARHTAQTDELPRSGNRPSGASKAGEMLHPSAQARKNEGHGASPWC